MTIRLRHGLPLFVLVATIISVSTIGGCAQESAGPRISCAAVDVQSQSASDASSANRAEVTAVVENLLEFVRGKDWTRAADYFRSGFRKVHSKELLNGSLLGQGRRGKSSQAVLAGDSAHVRLVEVRGDYAWVQVQVGTDDDSYAQVGLTTLELFKEQGRWRVVRFPPSRYASEAMRASHDSASVGQWLRWLLNDGEFTPDEQKQIADILPRYYGLLVERKWREEGSTRRQPPPIVRAADLTSLTELAERLKSQPELSIEKVVLWDQPSADVIEASRVLAKQVLHSIYTDLCELRDQHPELAKLDDAHVKLTDTSLFYEPETVPDHQKTSSPRIVVVIGVPYLGVSQMAFPQRILLAKQKLEIHRQVFVQGNDLKTAVASVIERNIRPATERERALGGEPFYENWR